MRASTAADGSEANNVAISRRFRRMGISSYSGASPRTWFPTIPMPPQTFSSRISSLVPSSGCPSVRTVSRPMPTASVPRFLLTPTWLHSSAARPICCRESPNVVPDVFAASPSLTSGGGVDTVESAIPFVLPANVENLTLVGTADISGTGNALANILAGNTGNNALFGGPGDDGLFGGVGNDNLDGGDGVDYASYLGPRSHYAVLINNGQVVVGQCRRRCGSAHVDRDPAFCGSGGVDGGRGDSALEYIASYPDLTAAFGRTRPPVSSISFRTVMPRGEPSASMAWNTSPPTPTS